jgi:hypothetical protein
VCTIQSKSKYSVLDLVLQQTALERREEKDDKRDRLQSSENVHLET